MKFPTWPNKVTGMVTGSFAAGLLVAGILNLPLHSSAAPNMAPVGPPNAALVSLSDAYASVAERVKPSVVYIESSHRRRPEENDGIPREFAPFFQGVPHPRRQPEVERGSGSGFIVSPDGDILTNAHVVDGADKVMVRLLDRREFTAKVIGTDPTTDIALLHVEASGLTPATLGNSDDSRVGEWVLAVGNPLGENLSFTVTSGIISAKGRTLELPNQSERSIQDFIQTDAAINPGNSGGPLVNVRGEVIGVNAAIASETGYYTGYGFAIPMNIARRVMDELAHGGRVHRAMLGVKVKDATETDAAYVNLPNVHGVVVEDLGDDKSPARLAGLEQGDVIVAVDGKSVDYVAQVQQAIAFRKPGDDVSVEVARKGGVHRTLHVTLQEAPTPPASAELARAERSGKAETAAIQLGSLGLSVRAGELDGVAGLLVTAVDEDGPSADHVASPDEGGPDVIVSIEGMAVPSPREAESALGAAGHGSIVQLVIYNVPAHTKRIERVRLP